MWGSTIEAWVAHLDALGIDHSPIIEASLGWLLVFDDPDGLQLHLYTWADTRGPSTASTNQDGRATAVRPCQVSCERRGDACGRRYRRSHDPDNGGVINACYKTSTGALRTVAADVACRADENPLAWNQTGPHGPQGEQDVPGAPGPEGETGPAGPQGPVGPSDAYFGRAGDVVSVSVAWETNLVTVPLPAGQ